MNQREHFELLKKFFSGQCSTDELKKLQEQEAAFQLLDLPWRQEMGDEQEIKEQILTSLHEQMHPRRPFRWKYFSIAASMLLVCGLAYLNYPSAKKSNPPLLSHSKKTHEIVVPGSSKAVLTLSDGSSIDLDDSHTGMLCKQGNVKVDKLANGQLVYNNATGTADKSIYNTITTPRGGEYQVVLSDGTRVWLNAASALKFPATFSCKQRRVELVGEAYFEVAKNKSMPFTVSMNKMAIEVLGTHFNVNAYPDEDEVKTTLLEGSVKLRSGQQSSMLKPGEQAVLGSSNSFQIHPVDVEEAVAWKNGYFIFDNENIQGIMRKVSRWYDVDVEYSGKVDEGSFGGTVSRFKSVSGILKSLELTGTVHFKLEGRRITVMP
jgi:ferric-dicitrate binding protein FerR (iron transport regulator)